MMRSLAGILLLLLLTSLALQGCAVVVVGGAAVGAGAATVAWVRGELQSTYPAPMDGTWDATLGALKELGIRVYSSKKDATAGFIEASKVDATKVKINLEPAGPGTTTVKIRMGTFGDEEASMAIHREISRKLGVK